MVQADDKEAVITQAEHRIEMALQRDAEERWKNRMANEDKITTNTIEVLRSDLKRISAEMAEEVVCMQSSHHGSAATTVSGSRGSGGSAGNFAGRLVHNTFVASETELKGGAVGETFAAPVLRWMRPKNLSVLTDEKKISQPQLFPPKSCI